MSRHRSDCADVECMLAQVFQIFLSSIYPWIFFLLSSIFCVGIALIVADEAGLYAQVLYLYLSIKSIYLSFYLFIICAGIALIVADVAGLYAQAFHLYLSIYLYLSSAQASL